MNSAASRILDFVKATRSQWLTRPELMAELGLSRNAVNDWTDECTAQGFFVSRKRDRAQVDGGHAPVEFTLSRAWGGQADV